MGNSAETSGPSLRVTPQCVYAVLLPPPISREWMWYPPTALRFFLVMIVDDPHGLLGKVVGIQLSTVRPATVQSLLSSKDYDNGSAHTVSHHVWCPLPTLLPSPIERGCSL